MANGKSWDRSQLRKYDLKLEEVPRLNFDDPQIDEFITNNVSVYETTQFQLLLNILSYPNLTFPGSVMFYSENVKDDQMIPQVFIKLKFSCVTVIMLRFYKTHLKFMYFEASLSLVSSSLVVGL